MVVVPVYTKPDDQYPLLMVAGAGDAAARELPPVVVNSMLWNSSAAPRRPWSERWPEYLSTCWMTLILLGISFLVFYAVGMVVVYRHESFILVKCNDTKPASEVFYHSIIPRGGAFPLAYYAEYLANMATLYPHLRFNVHFLIDDSPESQTRPLESRIFGKLRPYSAYIYDTYNRREVRCFQKKHPNVNITVMLLSKYMAMTPLKYRWKNIPTQSIPFYARVFSVWANAGIGLDIDAQNQQYHLSRSQRLDRKIKAILKQHNDGITPEKYMEALKRVDETEHEYLSYIVETVQKFFIESIFNKTMTSNQPTNSNDSSDNSVEPSVPLSETKSSFRTRRSKRDVLVANQDDTSDNATSTPANVNIVLANSTTLNGTSGSNMQNVYQIASDAPNDSAKTVNKMSESKLEEDEPVKISDDKSNGKTNILKSQDNVHGSEKNKSNLPQIVLFYDFSIISEPLRYDSYISNTKNLTSPLNVVTIETEGTFIASTSSLHPFLGTIFSGACRRLPPRIAIQHAFLTRCPGTIRDEKFCNSIFVL